MAYLHINSEVQFVTGPSPIPALACGPDQLLDRFTAAQAGFSALPGLTFSHLLHARLDLSFPRSIATAMALSPALRPVAPVQRQLP
jgi:hypothetical protein